MFRSDQSSEPSGAKTVHSTTLSRPTNRSFCPNKSERIFQQIFLVDTYSFNLRK
jgi:hypothetical protein